MDTSRNDVHAAIHEDCKTSCKSVRKQLQGKFENARLKQQFDFKTDHLGDTIYTPCL